MAQVMAMGCGRAWLWARGMAWLQGPGHGMAWLWARGMAWHGYGPWLWARGMAWLLGPGAWHGCRAQGMTVIDIGSPHVPQVRPIWHSLHNSTSKWLCVLTLSVSLPLELVSSPNWLSCYTTALCDGCPATLHTAL